MASGGYGKATHYTRKGRRHEDFPGGKQHNFDSHHAPAAVPARRFRPTNPSAGRRLEFGVASATCRAHANRRWSPCLSYHAWSHWGNLEMRR
jgi:hypothetical protein